MSTITMPVAVEAADGRRFSGVLRRAFARVIAAREARARRLVDAYLARLGVAELRRQGYSDGRIADIRSRGAQTVLPIL